MEDAEVLNSHPQASAIHRGQGATSPLNHGVLLKLAVLLIVTSLGCGSLAHANESRPATTDSAAAGAATTTAAQTTPQQEPVASAEPSAEETLRDARSHYERGDFERAATSFATILDTPVTLRTRQDLHEGFLYFAFTLLLQGEPHSARAAEKLRYALRLDPDHLPSPVTTRPDILEFYNRQRDAYIAANGPVSEPPQIVFPELQASGTSTRVLRKRWFVPAFGIGLRFLGHPKTANLLMGTEIAALGLNISSLLLRVALIEDLSPAGFAATEVGRYTNYISFSVFWIALIADVVISLALRRSYERHPERRPSNRSAALRRRGRTRPQLAYSARGLTIEF